MRKTHRVPEMETLGLEVLAVLPQIRALVEAAEREHAVMREVYGERGRDDSDQDIFDAMDAQDLALADLDKALPGD